MSLHSPPAPGQGDHSPPDLVALGQTPRLGEFSQLMNSARAILQPDVIPEPPSPGPPRDASDRDPLVAEKPSSKLGDFHKILERFQPRKPSPTNSLWQVDPKFSDLAIQIPDSLPFLASSNSLPCRIRRRQTLSRPQWPSETPLQHLEPSNPNAADLSSPELDFTSESDQSSETRRSAVTPASTPPTPQPQFPLSEPRKRASKKELWSPTTQSKKALRESKDQANVLFSYNTGKGCLPIAVYGRVLSRAERHRILLLRLSLHRAVDTTISQQFPAIAANGTHVFIDMSNIEINFLQALKARHSLADQAYPMPRTHLDLGLLTEILLRGRHAVTQSVGCSVVPGRHKPWYIPEFKRLGYHVDLRHRKPVQDCTSITAVAAAAVAAASSSTSTSSHAPLSVRYVEDLVDETLQTRIAEAVMEYFDQQGTIVLATGDAKPAEYSDGFFTYVERALRMGWNVELASWKSSLSSTWTSHRWKSQWGNKFRIIELDSYLDLLLASDT